MADRNGGALRRVLRSADRFTDSAIARGLFRLNTPGSRSIASLVSITRRDHRRGAPLVAMEIKVDPAERVSRGGRRRDLLQGQYGRARPSSAASASGSCNGSSQRPRVQT
jgi:hypothetical protein